jgi:uncharacterized repeat protein (TIGR02543 family)
VGSPSVGSAGGSGGFGAGSGGGGTGAGVAGTYAGTGGFGNTGSGGGGGAALGGAFFVAPGGTLTINGMTSSSLTGTFSVTGGAAGAGGTTPATAGQALGQYLFVGTGGNTTLNVASGQAVTLGDSSNPFVISNAIAGSSGTLTKSGSGTLRLYGDYQNFSNSTIAVTGGTLGGTFTLSNSALSVSNGGKLSPGNASAGVMVVGSLSLAANSVLEFDLGVPNGGPGNASDTIFVTGTLPSIGANTVLNVTAVNQFAAGTYSIIEYHGAGIPSAGGLTVGTMPAGYAGSISTSGTGPYYINLVVTNAYTVTYDGNGNTGGTVPTDSTGYASNASVTVLGNTGNLTKTGYTFAGWTTVANGGTDFGASFNITANTTLYAKWTINAYTVTPSAGTGGSISPSGVQTVNHGSTTSFTVSPSPGYSIASVGGTCGGSLSGSTFTTAAVTGNCAVTATFSAIPPVDTTTPTADIPLFNVAAGCSTIGGPSPVNMQQGAGPAFLTDMLAILGNAISQQLNFAGQGGCGALVIFYSGGTLSFMPYGFVANDPRPNGIYPVGNGQFQIVRNGQSLTVALSLVNLDQLAALLRAVTSNRIDIEGAKVLPAGTIMQTEGGALIANLNGTTYAVQPALNVQKDPPIAQASFSIDASGQVHFTDTQGNNQILYPAFAEPASLRSIVQSLLPGATVNVQLDGTALVEANGVRLTLVPDMVLTNTPADRAGQTWWQESATRFRFANVSFYLNGLTQGLTLKP